MSKKAQIVGSGIIGLTTAICLLDEGFTVNIITRERPEETTSTVAGAIWAGYGLPENYRNWARTSLAMFQAQARNTYTGVLLTQYREVFTDHQQLPWYCDALNICEHIPSEELPEGYVSGFLSEVPLVQSPKYIAYLLQTFYALGGTIEYREIKSLSELADDNTLIINCTGVQAKYVAKDDAVHPIWGQVLRVDAPHIQQAVMDDERFTYVFPRKDGVILGGIHVHDRWQREPDAAITADIIARCQKLLPELTDINIREIHVGLRPGRKQVRLEVEKLTDNCTVIHNYGHGGVGYTLSWGCAREVRDLANRFYDL